MAAISIARLIFVLPVPVTAYSQTKAKDIITRAEDTTLTTGMASEIKSSPCPKTDKNKPGNKLIIKQKNSPIQVLITAIFLISPGTSSFSPDRLHC